MDPLQPCQTPAALWLKDPWSPTSTSADTLAPPWLLAPLYPLWPISSSRLPHPSGSTMAASSLVSTVAHQSTSSVRLPHPSGSTLVILRHADASGLHSSSFISTSRDGESSNRQVRITSPIPSPIWRHSFTKTAFFFQPGYSVRSTSRSIP